MLKKLFAAMFGTKKRSLPERPTSKPVPRTTQAVHQPRSSARSSSDDSLTNPMNPLHPRNPLHHNSYDHYSPSRCDDRHHSSWGCSSDYSSSSSSSDSSSSCSSSCD